MLTSRTRWLWLQAGHRSLTSIVRAGHLPEPGLASDARAAYDRMADQVPWPDQTANRFHVAINVLPLAALYTVLRERGWTEEHAVDTLRAASITAAEPQRKAWTLMLRTQPGRRLYLRSVGPNWLGMFPPPAWAGHWVERSQNRVGFDMTRCYIVDTFRQLDAAPVAPAFCATEAYLQQGCPYLRFSRTGTLASGADRCDYRYELLPVPTPLPAGEVRLVRGRREQGSR